MEADREWLMLVGRGFPKDHSLFSHSYLVVDLPIGKGVIEVIDVTPRNT